MSEQTFIETSHGRIAVSDVNGSKTPLLMLHCNSGCKEMFVFQQQALTGTRRLVSLDLPGHGASSDAIDPRRTSCFGGYAEAVTEVLTKLDIDKVAILGHSLGGHIALDLAARLSNVAGLMIFGTPPSHRDLKAHSLASFPIRRWRIRATLHLRMNRSKAW